jgi:hypothetical protein
MNRKISSTKTVSFTLRLKSKIMKMAQWNYLASNSLQIREQTKLKKKSLRILSFNWLKNTRSILKQSSWLLLKSSIYRPRIYKEYILSNQDRSPMLLNLSWEVEELFSSNRWIDTNHYLWINRRYMRD